MSDTLVCMESGREGHECRGEVTEGRSQSGASRYVKCEAAWIAYEEKMIRVHADISSRYPGYDNPNSMPPAGFDPSYAGESWDEVY